MALQGALNIWDRRLYGTCPGHEAFLILQQIYPRREVRAANKRAEIWAEMRDRLVDQRQNRH